MKLWDELRLSEAEFPCVIAIVGSGGKTTLMEQLAQEGVKHHLRVAMLTTTHIRKTSVYHENFSPIAEGTAAVFGRESGEDKLAYPGDDCYAQICRGADLILAEADGSRGMPVKFPAAYEPVIPENVNKIICVFGMSGLGQPAAEVCHRWELAMKQGIGEVPAVQTEAKDGQARITEALAAELLETGYGGPLQQAYPQAEFSYCLNQADTPGLQAAAAEILKRTGQKGVICSLWEDENRYQIAMIYLASGFGRRYGTNKLLSIIDGKPLYAHGLQALCQAAVSLETEGSVKIKAKAVVVSQYEEILQAARTFGALAVYNPDSLEGITASIRHGIAAVPKADAYLFAVADQPWLKPESVQKLMKEFCTSEKNIACLTDGTRNGNPVIFSGAYKEELQNLTGDRGGSAVLRKHPQDVLPVIVEEKELQDIDVPA